MENIKDFEPVFIHSDGQFKSVFVETVLKHYSASEGVIQPATVFKGFDPFIFNVCAECRTFNARQELQEVSPGMVQIPLALCLIYRAHFIQARARKFYDYDVTRQRQNQQNCKIRDRGKVEVQDDDAWEIIKVENGLRALLGPVRRAHPG
ncbi:hypothetical protein GCK72_003104 [Caenorhabditis remanei]|uniref:Uncharacterized protein n=1 Tax=Caenorhabditis remanei TaxID=31234 RepID=A0A6A5HTK5_CAERE|nr:hypothetical protein GCK72_003104 [Caenorhabditis remanei]KAF1771278.1 hypothetical protein GCK72_003104 [Caenorhabditis remanei]